MIDATKIDCAKAKLTVKKTNLGKAGEHFVAAKLLLNGFNVFFGAIDDGIDLIARKKRRFYYIQVKTCQDIDYDSGKFVANINLDTINRFPLKVVYFVFVLHFLGVNTSVDYMGDHNWYDQAYIVLPAIKLMEFVGKTSGKVTLNLDLSILRDGPDKGWIVKMKGLGKEIILDDYLIDSFWQIEI